MKIRLKVLYSALLAGSLVLGAAGCSQKDASDVNSTSPAQGDKASGLPAPGDFSKKLDLKLSGSFTRGKIEDGNWVQKKLEEKYNIKINNVKVDTFNKDQVQLMVASGDLPDTFAFTAQSLSALEFYENGLTRTVSKEMLKKYAPRYSKMLDENVPGWDMNLAPGKKDEYLTLVGYQGHTKNLIWAPTFRLDWLEKLGIKPPGDIKPIGTSGGLERIYFSDKAYTLEQTEEILKAFTQKDPDGNGKNDTYGMLPFNNAFTSWGSTLLGAYGVASGYNLEENGKLTAAEISDKYKEFLKMMARWNKEGLIDPEWTTIDVNKSWEKYKLGKAGYYPAQPAYVGMDAWTKGRAPANIVEKDPAVKLLVTAPEIGPNGQQGEGAFTPVNRLGDAFYISKKVTDEQLTRILQIFDYINFDDDSRWTLYGEVGTQSTWQGTPEKSEIKVKPEYPENEGNMGFWAYNFRSYDDKRASYQTSEATTKLKSDFFGKPDVLKKMEIRPFKWDLMNQTKYADLNKQYKGQLDTIVNEFRLKAIAGQIDIDKEWDKYVQNYLNSGGKEILAELEKAPKVADLLNKK
ncbi:ABC transporter substrate-binding protein [Paenibacillus sp. LMG 31458]|uniref:ABC transporter substrate-binding protein n=1 Tax=Paenibacillus phytorum TaxID=2654977 RepID=A0ABX1Y1S0_9BACL|nr:ABC transporter substrate-binding protein [Paenibacillus phytorum]NOU74211.1 ABC transporter substrate-binding protein [Paenibacillus phytorum]